MDNRCVLPHRDGKEGRAATGLYLCTGHLRRLTEDLAALPGLHEDLADRLVPTGGSSGPKVAVSRDPGIQINAEVARVRCEIRDSLITWTRAICEDRGLIGPSDGRPHVTAAWLGRADQPDWCAGQDWADEYAEDMHRLVLAARGLLQPSGTRRVVMGPCPLVEDDQTCDGTVVAWVRDTDATRPSEAVCDECGAKWEKAKLRQLAMAIKAVAA